MLHIKIPKDGEAVIDCETNGIIAVVNQEDTVAALTELNQITGGDMLALIEGLDKLKNDLLQAHPEMELMLKLKAMLDDRKKADDKNPMEELLKEIEDI